MKIKNFFLIFILILLNILSIYFVNYIETAVIITLKEVVMYSIFSGIINMAFGILINFSGNLSAYKHHNQLTTPIILFILSFMISVVPIILTSFGIVIRLDNYPNTPVIVINQLILGYTLVDLFNYKNNIKGYKKLKC